MRWLVLVALLATACGGSGSKVEAKPEKRLVTVEVQAEPAGLGCTQSPVKRGTRLVVSDSDGTTIGEATFELTPHTDSCDWQTLLAVPASDFYRLSTDAGNLVTVNGSEMRGTLLLHVDFNGEVTVA